MAMETVVVMAFAMGRTLVLPPNQKMYLLGKVKFIILQFNLSIGAFALQE